MRKTLAFLAVGLSLALAGAAVASDHTDGKRHSDRSAERDRSHDDGDRAKSSGREHDERKARPSDDAGKDNGGGTSEGRKNDGNGRGA